MAYLKTIVWTLIASATTGAAVVVGAMAGGFGRPASPTDRATALAAGISEGMNCAAFLAILVLPFAIVNAFLSRRHARRTTRAPAGR